MSLFPAHSALQHEYILDEPIQFAGNHGEVFPPGRQKQRATTGAHLVKKVLGNQLVSTRIVHQFGVDVLDRDLLLLARHIRKSVTRGTTTCSQGVEFVIVRG